MLIRNEPSKLRQDNVLAGEAAGRGAVLVSVSQKSLPYTNVKIAREKRKIILTYFAKPPGLWPDRCLET